MIVSYPKPCYNYNEADYEGNTLYMIGILKDTKSIINEQFYSTIITQYLHFQSKPLMNL